MLGKNQKGQTSVEYILLLVVVIFVGGSVFDKLKDYLVSGPNSVMGQYLGSYENMFSGQNGAFRGQYKRFTIKGK